jgi:hypothetical protein
MLMERGFQSGARDGLWQGGQQIQSIGACQYRSRISRALKAATDNQDRNARIVVSKVIQQSEAIKSGHDQIECYEVGLRIRHQMPFGFVACGRMRAVFSAQTQEELVQQHTLDGIIIDDEYVLKVRCHLPLPRHRLRHRVIGHFGYFLS